MKKILFIRLTSAQEVIFSLPAVKKIKEAYPDASLIYLTAQKFTSLAVASPWVDEVAGLDLKRYESVKEDKHTWEALKSLKPMLNRLQTHRFDALVDFENRWLTNYLAYRLTAGKRIAIGSHKGSFFYSEEITPNPKKHLVEDYLETLNPLGVKQDTKTGEFDLRGAKLKADYIKRLLEKHNIKEEDKTIVVCPSRGGELFWTEDKLIKFGNWISGDLKGRLVVAGEKTSKKQIERIKNKLKGRVLDFTEHLDWGEGAEFLRRADVVVGASDPYLHLAQAVATPVLALYGSEDPTRVGPYGGQSMILKTESEKPEDIRVEAVTDNLETILSWNVPFSAKAE